MEKIFKVRKLLNLLNFGVVSLVRRLQKIQDFSERAPIRLMTDKNEWLWKMANPAMISLTL